MEKIILKSLELAGFKNASTIADIVNCTPNPRVATEMLLGVYEPLTIQSFGQHWKHRYRDEMTSVVSVDELHMTVKINVYKAKTAYMYYETQEDYKNDVNGTFTKRADVTYYDWKSKTVPGIDVSEKSMDLLEFKDNYSKQLTTEEFVDLYNEWAYDPAEHVQSPTVSDAVELSDNLPF